VRPERDSEHAFDRNARIRASRVRLGVPGRAPSEVVPTEQGLDMGAGERHRSLEGLRVVPVILPRYQLLS
jgi:hypothetical protein